MSEAVLIVEDDEETRRLLARALRRQGLQVLTAGTGSEGLELIRRHAPAVVLLDLVLPEVSGEAVCVALRADPELAQIHVIMLTGMTKQEDRIAGFELGADDYVTKPFDLEELTLRVEAALRRQRQRREEREEGLTVVGAMTIDTERQRVRVKGEDVTLTAAEYRLLVTLVESRGKAFSREQLAQGMSDADEQASPRSVDTHIMRLRNKLGPAADLLETVRGVGYRVTDWA
jgi:two-component system phosphate regulon response regulator PhoB